MITDVPCHGVMVMMMVMVVVWCGVYRAVTSFKLTYLGDQQSVSSVGV